MNLTDGKRPVVFFDLETTGTNLFADRIVEIAAIKILPDGTREEKHRLLNPGMHIPEEASAVHHITDDDVKDMPTFRQVAKGLMAFLEGCDLIGYNITKFDVPMLEREFRDCDVPFSLDGRRIIDAFTIFRRMEPRDLTAAYKFFCGKKLEGAHGAFADTQATLEVYEAELQRYQALASEDLPNDIEVFPQTMDELHQFCNEMKRDNVDLNGRFKWRNGEACVSFGRYNGSMLKDIAADHPDFLSWIIRSDFTEDVKQIAKNALNGKFPVRQK